MEDELIRLVDAMPGPTNHPGARFGFSILQAAESDVSGYAGVMAAKADAPIGATVRKP